MKSSPLPGFLLWSAFIFCALFFSMQLGEHSRLTRAISSLPSVKPLPAMPSAPPGKGHRANAAPSSSTTPAEDPAVTLTDFFTTRKQKGNDYLECRKQAATLLTSLPKSHLADLVGDDPVPDFAQLVEASEISDDLKIQAWVREWAMERWLILDPREALRRCVNPPGGEIPGLLASPMQAALKAWAAVEPRQALLWAKNHAARLRYGMQPCYVLLADLSTGDFPGSLNLARETGLDLTGALPFLIRNAGSPADVDLCLKDLSELPGASGESPGENPASLFLQSVTRLGNSNGFTATRILVEKWGHHLPGAEEAALQAASTTFSRGATGHAQSLLAADWLMNFIPEAHRPVAVEKLINTWADEDFNAPAEWLQKNRGAPWQNAGLAAFCRKIAPFDPEAATAWAAGITDETQCAALLQEISTTPPRR